LPRAIGKSGKMFRPIMERCRVEVCTIWPHESMHFRIQPHTAEEVFISQRPIERTRQHRLEIDFPHGAISKRDAQPIWANNREMSDAMEGMHDDGIH
jgi:hypothetical protein